MIASGAELPVLGNIRSSIQIGEIELLHTFVVVGGLGAVLEQEGHVIAYASRALTEPERHYSVIQKECLALVYAFKALSPLSIGELFPAHHRSRPTSLAISAENERYVVSLGSLHAGV